MRMGLIKTIKIKELTENKTMNSAAMYSLPQGIMLIKTIKNMQII